MLADSRTRFRPCIDLHEGRVKQIVGGSLRDSGEGLRTHYVADRPAAAFAARYREDGLTGGHMILLGPGNQQAALDALAVYPGGLQVGGGINRENAAGWLEAGAAQVIVTSHLFSEDGHFQPDRLDRLAEAVGRDRLVVDLSCRRQPEGGWQVAMNRWQTPTDLAVSRTNLQALAGRCAEFLVHAADVEGLSQGIDRELVALLAEASPIPVTYAGGARSLDDLRAVQALSGGRVDLTIGSALDLFGGSGVRYADCLKWNRGEVA
jgi:phosphoribosylformimino-5-aminoimidazole carboxamide ribotide isomerase